jgi:hypothetical protein
MTTPHVVPAPDLARLRSAVVSWFSGVRNRVGVRADASFSSSASTEFSRLEGGQLKELWDDGRKAIEDTAELIYGCPAPSTGSRDEDTRIVVDSAIQAAVDYYEQKRLPVVRATAVDEIGGKCRIVTAGPACLVFAGNSVRKFVWPALDALVQVDASGLEDREVKASRRPVGQECLSRGRSCHMGRRLFGPGPRPTREEDWAGLAGGREDYVCRRSGRAPLGQRDPYGISVDLVGALHLQSPHGLPRHAQGSGKDVFQGG